MGSQQQYISFNVAGQRFTTSKDTILREPASRLALIARGVLPAAKDETGSIFLDRDARYFQLVLNYLRDGWCQLPKSVEERRELLQEIRYYQLAGMEAWMRTQDVLGEASLRPQDPDPYSCPNAGLSHMLSSPAAQLQQAYLSAPGHSQGSAGSYAAAGDASASSSPGTYLIRSSFLSGANQDLLTAGAFAGIRLSSISPPPAFKSASIASPEPAGLSSPGLTFSPSLAARPSSASPYFGGTGRSGSVDMAAGYAAGFAVGQQQGLDSAAAAVRRSLSPEPTAGLLAPGGDVPFAMTSTSPSSSNKYLPAQLAQDGFKWTGRYLANNAQMQEVVNTLLELAHLPPHPSLHAGKTTISIASECDHDRITGLVGVSGLDSGRFRYQVLRVKSTMGWSYEFSLRPSSDLALYDKYNIAEYLQDNWFVLSACLKDMYGIVVEEDAAARPKCVACRRSNISFTLQKFF